MSRWLAKRIRPRLAYLTCRYCTASGTGWPVTLSRAALPPGLAGAGNSGRSSGPDPGPRTDVHQRQLPDARLPHRARLDLGAHRRADAALVARRPAAVVHLG